MDLLNRISGPTLGAQPQQPTGSPMFGGGSILPIMAAPQPIGGMPGTPTPPPPAAEIPQAPQAPAADPMLAHFQKMLTSATLKAAQPEPSTGMNGLAGKTVGGLLALFGGPAGGIAGRQLIQDAHQQVLDAKAEGKSQQQDALQGVKLLTDIIANTDPKSQKNMALQLNAEAKKQNADTNEFKANTSAERLKKYGDFGDRKLKEVERHNLASEDLRNKGLDVQAAKLDQIAAIARGRAHVALKIQQLRSQDKRDGQDATRENLIARLHERELEFNAQQKRLSTQFDASMKLAGGKTNVNGDFVYKGATIPSLMSSGAVGLEDDLSSLNQNPHDKEIEDASALIDQLMGPIPSAAQAIADHVPTPPQATPYAPGGGMPPGLPILSTHEAEVKHFGSGIEGAKKKYASLPPAQQAKAATQFYALFGKHPWDK